MKSKKFFLILIGIVICLIVVLLAMKFIDIEKVEEPTEIVPGEEMTEEQERQTIISLYYINSETNTLIPEAKVIDAKELLENPYKTLIEYLGKTPKNDKLKSSLPDGTKINNVSLIDDVLVVDLSKEFIENRSTEDIKLSTYSIVNTLTELNEIKKVKILIDGEEKNEIIEERS